MRTSTQVTRLRKLWGSANSNKKPWLSKCFPHLGIAFAEQKPQLKLWGKWSLPCNQPQTFHKDFHTTKIALNGSSYVYLWFVQRNFNLFNYLESYSKINSWKVNISINFALKKYSSVQFVDNMINFTSRWKHMVILDVWRSPAVEQFAGCMHKNRGLDVKVSK